MYEDSIHAGGVLKGVLLGAVLGVWVYTTLRQKFDWYERRLDALDRDLCAIAHPPSPPADAPAA